MSEDKTAERESRCLPIVRTLLKKLADQPELVLGDAPREEVVAYYQKIYIDVFLPVLLQSEVKLGDIGFIFRAMAQAIQEIQFVTEATLIDTLYNQATAKLWGKTNTDDVTVNDLDQKLKEHFASTEQSVDK